MLDVTNRTPLTRSASSLVLKSSWAFSSIGTVNGSISCGVIQRPSGTLVDRRQRRLHRVDAVVAGRDAPRRVWPRRPPRLSSGRVSRQIPTSRRRARECRCRTSRVLLTPVICRSRVVMDSVLPAHDARRRRSSRRRIARRRGRAAPDRALPRRARAPRASEPASAASRPVARGRHPPPASFTNSRRSISPDILVGEYNSLIKFELRS